MVAKRVLERSGFSYNETRSWYSYQHLAHGMSPENGPLSVATGIHSQVKDGTTHVRWPSHALQPLEKCCLEQIRVDRQNAVRRRTFRVPPCLRRKCLSLVSWSDLTINETKPLCHRKHLPKVHRDLIALDFSIWLSFCCPASCRSTVGPCRLLGHVGDTSGRSRE